MTELYIYIYIYSKEQRQNANYKAALTDSVKASLSTMPSRSRDWTGLIILLDLFLVSFSFSFAVCSVWSTKLAFRQLFTAH